MSRFLKIFFILLTVIISLILAIAVVLYFSYKNYNPEDEFLVDRSQIEYFSETYDDSRSEFILKADSLRLAYPDLIIDKIMVPSKVDTALYTDYLYLPSKNTDKLLILISGTHGTEAFVGAAMQNVFINKYLNKEFLEESAVLLIHGMNPYGFKYNRRVTENNVDLNRNSDINRELFAIKNPGYKKTTNLINPEQPVDLGGISHRLFIFKAIAKIAREGMNTLRQAILQGQYEYPKGLYHGGMDFEPQISNFRSIFDTICKPYQMIFAIDLHTGYGERGKMHLFPNPVEPKVQGIIESIFSGVQIDWGDKESFYTVTGSFVDFIGLIHPGKNYIPMVFEFGTLNSQKTFGSLKSLHYTILENQGAQFGYASKKDSIWVKDRFRNMFYPDSEAWRSRSVIEFTNVMDVAMEKYLEL